MTKTSIEEKVIDLVKNVINNSALVINSHDFLNDLEGWDSISSVDLEMSVEDTFNIKFDKSEFISLTDVDAIATNIQEKLRP